MAILDTIVDRNTVEYLVKGGATHESVASIYKNLFPATRGISARSARRYCKYHNITRLQDEEIEGIVRYFTINYGHTYGRKLMQGIIRALVRSTINVASQKRVSRALRNVAPVANEARARDLIDRTNPIPYYSPYFGYKCHLDQNEKIGQDYGCTHVVMINSCSRLVVGFVSLHVKNSTLIYEFVFRQVLCKYGIWEQARADHGCELALVGLIQNVLSHYRLEGTSTAYKQTTSTENNVADRFWPEVNSRINYPIKRARNALRNTIQDDDLFNLADPVFKYCVSWVMLYVTKDAVDHFITSWNHHRVPGPRGCIPIENMKATKRTAVIADFLIPSTLEAVLMYEQNGGRLNREGEFGQDPLVTRSDLYESRTALFSLNYATSQSHIF